MLLCAARGVWQLHLPVQIDALLRSSGSRRSLRRRPPRWTSIPVSWSRCRALTSVCCASEAPQLSRLHLLHVSSRSRTAGSERCGRPRCCMGRDGARRTGLRPARQALPALTIGVRQASSTSLVRSGQAQLIWADPPRSQLPAEVPRGLWPWIRDVPSLAMRVRYPPRGLGQGLGLSHRSHHTATHHEG